MAKLSRRNFMTNGLKGAGSLTIANALIGDAVKRLAAPHLSKISTKDFTHYTNQNFKLYASNIFAFEATLVDIQEVHHDERLVNKSNIRSSSFSIKWRIDTTERMDDGIYSLVHPDYGRMELFFCSIDHTSQGMIMETVFS